MDQNYYAYLEISIQSSPPEILKAIKERYSSLLLQINDASPEEKYKILEELELLDKVRDTLLDPVKRAHYDQVLASQQEVTGTPGAEVYFLCAHCGGNHRLGVKFCSKTGKRIEMTALICPSCGTSNPPGSRYCHLCGIQLITTVSGRPAIPLSYPAVDFETNLEPRDRHSGSMLEDTGQLRSASTPVLASSAVRPDDPVPVGSPPETRVIKRFGRVEYFSPMDVGSAYDMQVGFLLEEHTRQAIENALIHWTTLNLVAGEEEPIIRITPWSAYLRISPPMRDLKVIKTKDVFARFNLVPLQLTDDPLGMCDLKLDFEYRGEIVQSFTLPAKIQHPYRLGPLNIPHRYWKICGVTGGIIAFLDAALGLTQLPQIQFSFPTHIPLAAGLGMVSVVLILLAIVLWRKAARRVSHRF